jgi:hypothetical protein
MAKSKDFTNGNNSLRQESADIWGGLPAVADDNSELRTAKKERVEQVNIFDIQPDLTQPRRALPSVIRAAWDGHTATLTGLFSDWRTWAANAGWLPLIDAVLNGEEIERPDNIPAEISALLDIATLAASIRRDGLMNPVTLAKQGDRYHIESGERRWLAFHLLYASTDEARWQQIPARLVGEVNRWRQAAENNTRADLNAIGKARQFAVLLMELIAAEGEQFAGFDAFTSEQDFYAQVADGDAYRIPRGKGELLLNAMGLKNTQQLRKYRALLRLSPELWQLADDENWAEDHINRLLRGDTVSSDTVSNDEAPSPIAEDESTMQKTHGGAGGNGAKKRFVIPAMKINAFKRIINLDEDNFSIANPDLDARRLADIQEARAALDEFEQRILQRSSGKGR